MDIDNVRMMNLADPAADLPGTLGSQLVDDDRSAPPYPGANESDDASLLRRPEAFRSGQHNEVIDCNRPSLTTRVFEWSGRGGRVAQGGGTEG